MFFPLELTKSNIKKPLKFANRAQVLLMTRLHAVCMQLNRQKICVTHLVKKNWKVLEISLLCRAMELQVVLESTPPRFLF